MRRMFRAWHGNSFEDKRARHRCGTAPLALCPLTFNQCEGFAVHADLADAGKLVLAYVHFPD